MMNATSVCDSNTESGRFLPARKGPVAALAIGGVFAGYVPRPRLRFAGERLEDSPITSNYTELVSGYDFSRVSATAFLPVLARGEFTGIPYAKEMLAYLRSRVALPEESLAEKYPVTYAPFFEARFKSVNRILEEIDSTQILELAAGFSPRGMDFSQRGVLYVETDLPGMIEQKRQLVAAILGSIPANLRFAPASVLNQPGLMAACANFRPDSIAITTEGLLRYLTFPEKTQLAANVHAILSQYGGVWITPDIHLREWVVQRASADFHNRIVETVGRDLDPNYFDNLAHARSFFESCGFAVEERMLLDGIRDSVISLAQAPSALLDQLENRRTFVLRVR